MRFQTSNHLHRTNCDKRLRHSEPHPLRVSVGGTLRGGEMYFRGVE